MRKPPPEHNREDEIDPSVPRELFGQVDKRRPPRKWRRHEANGRPSSPSAVPPFPLER